VCGIVVTRSLKRNTQTDVLTDKEGMELFLDRILMGKKERSTEKLNEVEGHLCLHGILSVRVTDRGPFQKRIAIENTRDTRRKLRGTVKQVYLFFPGTLGFSKR
jgi:hypothetical protein